MPTPTSSPLPRPPARKPKAARRRAARPRRPRWSRLLAWLLAAWGVPGGLALAQVAPGALPSGGQVVVGSGVLQQAGNLLVIQQNSNRLGLDWQSFNIGSAATVEFRQPGAGAIALNRVLGNSGTEIYGQLKANGQVFLTNPNGVLFAPGSKVDVGGLVASTLDLSQQDFAAGRFVFEGGAASGAVVNQGQLNATAGGYLALFGPKVDNQGDIAVNAGSVVLASGRAATVSISGSGLLSAVVAPGRVAGSVANSGRIAADGGVVTLSAKSAQDIAASLVNNSGIVRANTLVERGGEIWLTGDNVSQTGTLSAAAPNGGDGGRIMVLADMKQGTARTAGTLDASAASGRGGFIETSGAKVRLADETRITTAAPGGRTGTWLVDPNDYTVAASGGDITGAALGTQLANNNVTISTLTQGTAGGNGDIFVNDVVGWSVNRLTLNAERHININAALNGSGSASLALEYGQGAVAAGNTATYTVSAPVALPAGANFSTKLGSNGTVLSHTVVTDLAALQAIDGNAAALAANYVLGADIDASSTATANGGLGFNPIGNETSAALSTTNSFGGRFDGLGHTISGLVIARPTAVASGLFATTNNATVRNLTLSGGSVSGLTDVGAVVGIAGGATALDKVRSAATVSGSANSGTVGGLAGSIPTGTITNSSVGSAGNLVAISGGTYAGGLVGDSGTGAIRNSQSFVNLSGAAVYAGGLAGQTDGAVADSSSTGSVQTTGNAWIGGLVGRADGALSFSNVTSSANVSATNAGTYAGGLIGGAYNVSVNTGSATGTVSGGQRTGGLVGDFSTGSSGASIVNASSSGNVSGSSSVGGLVGYATGNGSLNTVSASGAVSNATASGDIGGAVGYLALSGTLTAVTSSGSVSGGNAAGGVIGQLATNLALTPANVNNTTPASGSKTVSGVNYAGGLVGYSGSTAALSGFNGANALTVAVTATGTNGEAGGLAGRTNGPVNSVSTSGTVTSAASAGGLVGVAVGAGGFSSVSASGAVTGTGTAGAVGGLVGNYSNSGALTGTVGVPTASGAVQGGSGSSATTGGLVGSFNSAGGIVDASTAVTSTVAGGGDTGGLVGDATGTGSAAITGSTARGAVSGASNVGYVGGLVGDFNMPGGWNTVSAQGAVSGGNRTGGLAGNYGSAANITTGTYTPASVSGGTWVGGLVGYMNSAAAISGPSAGSPWVVATDVTANATGGAAGGLAGRTAGVVSNARATGKVVGAGDAGGLVGQADGTGAFTDVAATGSVSGNTYVGGLVGQYNSTGTLTRGSAGGAVFTRNTGGGLVGWHGGGVVTLSSATGSVNAVSDSTVYIGGLVGQFGANCYYCSNGYEINQSTATGAVRADAGGSFVGGLVGLQYSGSITGTVGSNSGATGAVSSYDSVSPNNSSQYVGGLVGYFGYYNNSGNIGNSNASGAVNGGYYTGGLVGYFNGTDFKDSRATGVVTASGYTGGLAGGATPYGTMSNVSATGAVVAGTNGSYVGGLFGYLNLRAGSSLSNGRASGAVSLANTSGYLGGLIGYLDAGSGTLGAINDSGATGHVSGGTTAGGLIGYAYNNAGGTAILNSSATGNVSGGATAGGLVGEYYRTTTTGRSDDITSSYATGNVSASTYVGGLVGNFRGAAGVVGSYATGNVTGRGVNGGVFLGGLVGTYFATNAAGSSLAAVSTSYASGRVQLAASPSLGSSSTVYAGGLVGYLQGNVVAVGLADSYATGAVTLAASTGRLYAGGLVGSSTNQNLARGYATGAVSATGGSLRVAGGLLALGSTVTVANSYWDSSTTGQATSVGGGTALSSAQMRQANSFNAWSIAADSAGTSTWRIYEGHTAPLLTRFLEPRTLSLSDASKPYDGTSSFGVGNLGGGILSDRIFAATPSADVGAYSVAAAGIYSVQNGYDLTVVGSATLTVTPRALTLAGVVADKVYDGNRAGTLLSAAQPSGIVAGESLTLNLGGASALFDTKDAGQNKAVAVSGVTLSDGSNGKASNYTLNAASTTASITPKALNAGGFTAASRAYDGSTTVAVSAAGGTLTGTVGSDDVQVNVAGVSSGTIADKNVGTGKAVTVLGVSLTGTDAGNYVVGGLDAVTVNITPRPLTVNGLTGNNRDYNQSTAVSVPTANGVLAGAVAGDTVQLRNTSVTGTMADRHVGNGKAVTVPGASLLLRGADASNYSVAAATATVNIAPAPVYFYAYYSGSNNKVYDGTDLANLQPYASPNFGYTLLGTTTTIGLDNLTLSYDAPRYSDKNVAYSSGNVTSKTITVANAALGGANAGNYVLANTSATVTGTITPLPLTVTGVSATNRNYDGSTNVAVNVSGATVNTAVVIPGDVVNVTLPGSGTVTGTIANKNVGNNKPVTVPGFSLSGADAGNYSLTGSSGVTVNITPKPLTATYTALDKVYDGNGYARISVASTDIVGADQVLFYADTNSYGCFGCYGFFVSNTSTPTNYTLSKDAAANKRVVVVDNALFGNDAGNYTLQNRTATLTASITPKGITPVFTGVNKVYDGTTTATVNVNTSASGIVSGDAVSLDRTATFDTKNVGTGKAISISGIAFSGINAGNYTLASTTATATAAITPKPLSVQGVTATDRAYDGSTTVGLTVGTLAGGGVVGSEAVTVLAPVGGIGSGTMASKGVGTGKAVTVAGLTLSGADAGNYTIDGSQGVTVNIAQRDLAVTYTGVNREYNGGVAAVVTPASTDIVPGDVLSFSQNAVFTGLGAKDVGTNKPVAISSIALVGANVAGSDASNYRLLNTTASTTASITPKAIGVTYLGLSRVYNGLGDLSANVQGIAVGTAGSDVVTFTQTARFVGDGAVGTGKAVNITNIALAGLQAANYSLLAPTATTTASITPRPLGISGVVATNRVYDGTRNVQLSTTGASVLPAGVLAGDTVSVVLPSGGVTTGSVATKDAGTNKDVTITGISLSGASAANYSVVGASGITVNITPKPLTAVYSAATRVYDGTTLATISGSSADILTGDLGAIGFSATGAFGNKNAGAGKAVAITAGFLNGAERNNYTLLNPTGSALADITRKVLTPGYNGGTRVYNGGVAAPVTAQGTGLVDGDSVTFTQTAVFTGANAKNVGAGKAIAISGIALSGADAANYSLLADTASATGIVTPKPISIDGLTGVTATPRTYDGTRSVAVVVSTSGTLSPSSADIVAGDSVSINLPSGSITTGTMANKDAGASKALVVDGLSLAGTDKDNYVVTATTGVTVNIAQKPLTAVYAGINKVYDGTTSATVGGSSSDIVGGDTVVIGGNGIYLGAGARNAGTGKSVSVLSGTLSGADATNYALVNSTGSATASITPKPVTATYTGLSKVYDGLTTALVAAGNTGFIAGDAVSLSQTAVFTGNKNVGNNKPIAVSGIALSGSDSSNYALTTTSASTTGSITPKPLRIDGLTGVSAVDRIYDGTTVVSVVVSASGPVAPNPADLISGDVVTVNAPSTGLTTGVMADKNVGNAKAVAVNGLNLAGADAANYSITATSGVTVNIARRPLTAVYTAASRVYDGSTAATVTGNSADIIGGDVLSIAGTGVFTGPGAKNVGSGKSIDVLSVTFGGADAPNYSLLNPTGSATGSITPRPVTVSYVGGTRVYDGLAAAPVSATTAGFIANDQVSVTQTAVFTGSGAKNVGTAKPVTISGITLAGTDAANYSLTASSSGVTASVTPRPLRIEGFTGVVATDRVYNGKTAVAISVLGSGSISANTADVVPGDDIAVVAPPSGSTAGTLLDKNVGNNKPVIVSGVTLSGADKDNYSVAAATGVTVNITPKPLTAAYVALDKVYDGTAVASITGNSADIEVGDLVTIGGTGLFVAGKAAGIGKAVNVAGGTLANVDAGNYTLLNTSGTVTATITPKTLTASYTGSTRVYDGLVDAPVLGTLTGLLAGDVVGFVQTAVFIGGDARNVGSGKAVNITGITLNGADAANYSLLTSSAGTTASVTPRPLNISGLSGLQAVDRSYDGTRDVQITGTLVAGGATGNVVPGDNVTINLPGGSVSAGTMVDKSAGTGKAVTVDGLTLGGTDAANYQITGVAGLTVNIAPRAVSLLGVAAQNRVYDGTRLVAIVTAGGSIAGVLAGDDLQLRSSGVTGTVADKNVGTGKAVTVSGLGLTGADAANYTVGGSGLAVDITPRTLLATASAANKVYDGLRDAAVTLADDRIAGDVLTLAPASALFASKDAGNGLSVLVSGLGLTGTDAGNYTLASSSLAATASILQAPLRITANSLSKVYGEAIGLPGSAFSASGLVAGESIGAVTLTSAGTAAAAGVTPSPYAITVSGASGGSFNPANYALSYIDGGLNVKPRPLTIAANSVVRLPTEANPSPFGFSTSAGGLVGGDRVSSIVLAAPAGSDGAPGGSVFTLVPTGAVFASGSAANYAITYGTSVLVVLPQPPLLTDVDTGSGSGNSDPVGFALRDPDVKAKVEAATAALERTAGVVSQPPAEGTQPPAGNADTRNASAPDLATLLSGDASRVSLPQLQRMPLISFEDTLRERLKGAPGSLRKLPLTPRAP